MRQSNSRRSTLASPVVCRPLGPAREVGREELLAFLDNFVANNDIQEEASKSGAVRMPDSQLATAMAQIKRMQRDLKGLPAESTPAPEPVKSSAGTVSTGKKITFDD